MNQKIIFDIIFEGKNQEICIKIYFDINAKFFYKVEDSKGKIIIMSKNWNNFALCFPKLTFTNSYCIGAYYENGLEQKLKDSNGLIKIPTAISVNSENPLFGKAAIEDKKYGQLYDFTILLNEKESEKFNWIQKDENDEYKIILTTYQGWKKTSIDKLMPIFIKSMITLLEEKIGEHVPGLIIEFFGMINDDIIIQF